MKKTIEKLSSVVDIKDKLIDIIYCAFDLEHNLTDDVAKVVKENLKKDDITKFHEDLLYSGGLGEYYTPETLSELCYELTRFYKPDAKSVYDPTIGTGNLVSKFYGELDIYGQEYNHNTYGLVGLLYPDMEVELGDTLQRDKFHDKKFDLIVSNPPYGVNWDVFEDDRFVPTTVNKKQSETAFMQHNLYHLNDEGVAIQILPHGVLFRGGKERTLRKYWLENNFLDTIISLPPNLFRNTTISVVLVIFNKNKTNSNTLIIDASDLITKDVKGNKLSPETISKILNACKNRCDEDKFSSVVTPDEIIDNDYNLNIPRYVDKFEPEDVINIFEVVEKISQLEDDYVETKQKILNMLSTVPFEDEETAKVIKMLGGK